MRRRYATGESTAYGGFAVLLVILNHPGLGFRLPRKKSLLMDYLPVLVLNALCFNGNAAMVIFFDIAGSLIASKVLNQYPNLQAMDWRSFYARRASCILPLVLAVQTIEAPFPKFTPPTIG